MIILPSHGIKSSLTPDTDVLDSDPRETVRQEKGFKTVPYDNNLGTRAAHLLRGELGL